MAKKYFYACAGMLMLVLASAVGYGQGVAQSGSPIYFAGVGGASAMVVGRSLYFMHGSYPTPTLYPQPVPGSADIVSVLAYNAGYGVPATTVVLSDGEVYHWSGAVQAWAFVGTYSGATPAAARSWGSLKVQPR